MINQALKRVQIELNAPKNQRCDYGGYNYRSCEDVIEAVKSILQDDELITLSDEMILLGDRYYIKAAATFYKGSELITVYGWAREEFERKKFDASQLTGCASSYARKYSLNGLLMIDDVKDADTNESHAQSNEANQKQNNKPEVKDDDKKWLNIDQEPKVLEGAHKLHKGGMTVGQVLARLRKTYKVSKDTASFIESELGA